MVSRTLLLSVAFSAWAQTALATTCQDSFIPVSVAFSYVPLPTNLNLQNLTNDWVEMARNMGPSLNTSANYVIGATFCEPTVNNASRRNTIQLLQHGIEYNRTYWSALGFTNLPQNNYVEFASNEGYPTLAIDRLCNGASSKPNGILFCQTFAQAEVLHQLVLKARTGTLPLGSSTRAFSTVVGVGHSLGSSITKIALNYYPNDLDAVVLTGFSTRFKYGFLGPPLYGAPLPAHLVNPARCGTLDPSYVTLTKKSGYDYINYYGDYDPALAQADYDSSATFTLGEGLTAPFAEAPTPNYKKVVFVADGEHDPFYCQTGATTVLNMANRGDCNLNVPTEVQKSFSSVPLSKYGYHITKNAGHSVNLHRTAPQTFSAIFSFLSAQGF